MAADFRLKQEDEANLLAEHFKLLGDKSRLLMIASLKERELCVCDLVELVGLSQPGVSQHLRKLKAGGVVRETKRGTWVYYALNVDDKPHLQAVLDHLPSMKEQVQALKNNC